jgi:hypothetical protein
VRFCGDLAAEVKACHKAADIAYGRRNLVSVEISLTTNSHDLLDYFKNTWQADFAYNGNGGFYDSSQPQPFSQFGAGQNGHSGVVLEGDLYYPVGGGGGLQPNSTLDSMDFGRSYAGGTSGPFSVTSDLHIDLGGVAPDSSGIFNEAIYALSHGGHLQQTTLPVGPGVNVPFHGLYDYFAEVGTHQVGTTGDDILYSFEGNDTLTGNGGSDLFTFDLHGLGALTTDFTQLGNDIVDDFVASNDSLIFGLQSSDYDTYAEVLGAATQQGADTVFDFGSLGTVTLENVNVADLVGGSNLFLV